MFYYILKKGGGLLLSLWCVITITFLLMHTIPGDPFIGDHPIPPEALQSLYAYYGLDQPLEIQYILYIKRALTFDFGSSILYPGTSINQLIKETLPISALLGFEALLLAAPLGIYIGSYSALKQTKWQDAMMMTICVMALSIPHFLLASLLQWIFSVKLEWLPIAFWGSFSHTILPAIALAAFPMASIARLTRASMIKVFEQTYIQTAKAKGLSSLRIVLRHGLRNALLPIAAYLGPMTAHIIMGSLIIEKIFSIPGLGKWLIHSIETRDYPVTLGLTIFFSFFLMLSIFLVDIICGLMDPRVRTSSQSSLSERRNLNRGPD